jgi:hypothetical protein
MIKQIALHSASSRVSRQCWRTTRRTRRRTPRHGIGADASQSWISPLANEVRRVSSGDDGLHLFTVSGAQAVMVSELELCGGQCLRGVNCSNRGSYNRESNPRHKLGRLLETRFRSKNLETFLMRKMSLLPRKLTLR